MGVLNHMVELLCYFLRWLLSIFPLWSVFCTIPDLYADIPGFYSNPPPPPSVYYRMLLRAQCSNEGGREGEVAWVANSCSQIIEQNNSRAQFNVPARGLMLGPIPGPGTAGYWGVELCGSCVSMILLPRLLSDC